MWLIWIRLREFDRMMRNYGAMMGYKRGAEEYPEGYEDNEDEQEEGEGEDEKRGGLSSLDDWIPGSKRNWLKEGRFPH